MLFEGFCPERFAVGKQQGSGLFFNLVMTLSAQPLEWTDAIRHPRLTLKCVIIGQLLSCSPGSTCLTF
jgi:hypothetical protein